MTNRCRLLFLAVLLFPVTPLFACGPYGFLTSFFRVELRDGTVLTVQPENRHLPFKLLVGGNVSELRWDRVEQLTQESVSHPVNAAFTNGDRVRGRWTGDTVPFRSGGERFELGWRNIARVTRIRPLEEPDSHARLR